MVHILPGIPLGSGMGGSAASAVASVVAANALLDRPLKKVVVYLDPEEFKSTWLGNKSIYRTRMAIADGGELVVLAPGIKEFGEDGEIDRLIRKYGYRTTPEILEAVKNNDDLAGNLSSDLYGGPGLKIPCAGDGGFQVSDLDRGEAVADTITSSWRESPESESCQGHGDGGPYQHFHGSYIRR